jgi:V-type H+-transporting ATPase subunit a
MFLCLFSHCVQSQYPCEQTCFLDLNYEVFMYPGQGSFQKFLVVAGVLMVPIMLMGKPLYILYKYVRETGPCSGNNHVSLVNLAHCSGGGRLVRATEP